MRIAKLLGLGLALVLMALAGGNEGRIGLAQADCSRTVSSGDSIQRAIDSASPGEVICIRAGTYQEGISLMKPLTLRGERRDSVVIVGSLSITNAVNVAVQSLTLRGGRGLVVVNSSKVALQDLRVAESEAAGVLISNSSVELKQSLISANKLQGVVVSLNSSAVVASSGIFGNGGDGISVQASQADISDNIISKNEGCGVSADPASTVTGRGNFSVNNRGGETCGGASFPKDFLLANAPALWVSATALEFRQPLGGGDVPPQELTVWNLGGQGLKWEARTSAAWLRVEPAQGSLAPGESAKVQVLVSPPSSGPSWVVEGQVEISAAGAVNSPVRVGVRLRLAVTTLSGHRYAVNSVEFSPDGRLLASGSSDDTIKLWDVATGSEVRTLSGHRDSVYSVEFSPDGRLLASGSLDRTIKVWYVGDLTGR